MQIHELNNYNGELNSDAFVAIDNGSDTGKVSVTGLLADTNADISKLDTFLNARIDNIIAGGTAPSASEIVDARLGADGVTYASLGDAIRDQVSDLKSDLNHCLEIIPSKNLYNPANKMDGYQLYSNGSVGTNSEYNFTGYIDVEDCEKITVMLRDFLYPGTSTQNAFYDSSKSPVTARNELGVVVYGTAKTFTIPSGAKYFGLAYNAQHIKTASSTIMVQEGETAIDYEPYGNTYIVLPSNETIEARGEYDTLDERLDAMSDGNSKPFVVEYWGDSLTQGNQDSTGVNRSFVLKSLLGDSWTVVNYGVGGEKSNTIATRQSAMTAIVKAGQLIPADTSDAVLEIVDQNGDSLNFRSGINTSGAASWKTVNPCYIAGVKGNLSRNGSSYSTVSWKFNRQESGNAVSIDRPVGIKMNSQTFDKNPVLIICIGQNEGWNRESDELVAQVKAMIEQANAERYIVVGIPHSSSYSWEVAGNEALNLEFGKHYIDIEKYMKTPIYSGDTIVSSYALQDAGLTPTAEDLTAVANNQYPPSIMYDGVHFNQYGYTVWANREYKVGQWLGYW